MSYVQKIWALVTACAALVLVIILYVQNAAEAGHFERPTRMDAPAAARPQLSPAVQSTVAPSHGVAEVLARRPQGGLDPARVAASMGKTMIDQIADPQRVFQALPWMSAKQKSDGRGYIEYDPYVIETKFVGDQVDIFLPELGITATGVVDHVTQVDGDILRWQGTFSQFSGAQNQFTITQTLKDRYAIGTFETSMGSFNLESKNGYGWVVNQQADFVLPKDGQDFVVPKGGS